MLTRFTESLTDIKVSEWEQGHGGYGDGDKTEFPTNRLGLSAHNW